MYIPLFNFERDRIIMETPIKFSGKPYIFYPDGIEYFSLYRTTRKVNTIQEIEYIGQKFIWLNPEVEWEVFVGHMKEMSDRSNGHVIRTYSEARIENICDQIWNRRKKPYCHKLRKVFFNPNKMFSKEEKRKIVQELIHPKKIYENRDIIDAIACIDGKVTMKALAEILNCSPPTVSKNIDPLLKIHIKSLNKARKLKKEEELLEKAIQQIKEEGNIPTVSLLKNMTPVRNYDLIRRLLETHGTY